MGSNSWKTESSRMPASSSERTLSFDQISEEMIQHCFNKLKQSDSQQYLGANLEES
jgi:hypothetical protein